MKIGVDLTDIARISRILERHPGFAERTFTALEMERAGLMPDGRRQEFLAGRFAVKEAVLKALGVGLSAGICMNEIEVDTETSGAPVLSFSGEALRNAVERGYTRYEASITHESGMAAGFVVLS